MSGGWFITGTDTGVGKTRVSRLLLEALKRDGHVAVGMKPVASGCVASAAGLRSDDAELLLAASGAKPDYADVNPYRFAPPIAPHLAAREMGIEIQREKILASFRRLQQQSPWVVVEGVGGWMVPLDEHLTMADIARAMKLPVILVVGLRLGCLNHALLTAQAIRRAGIPLAGWVANQIDPAMTHVPENMAALEQRIGASMLAQFPFETAAKSDVALATESIRMLMRFTSKPD